MGTKTLATPYMASVLLVAYIHQVQLVHTHPLSGSCAGLVQRAGRGQNKRHTDSERCCSGRSIPVQSLAKSASYEGSPEMASAAAKPWNRYK